MFKKRILAAVEKNQIEKIQVSVSLDVMNVSFSVFDDLGAILPGGVEPEFSIRG